MFLWHRRAALQTPEYRDAADRLAELCVQLSVLPVPWGLKWIAEARGIARAFFSQPVSDRRLAQSGDLLRWFGEWWSNAEPRG
jgi:hypothetical protein